MLTAQAVKFLSRADTVVYDRLVAPQILALCRDDAEKIYVGKSPGAAPASQEQINRLLVEKSRQGRLVVRLKGGDPFVFGRGGEEAEALAAAGVPFRVAPGVTAGVAAAAMAGIPLTHRKLASAVVFVTGHEEATKDESAIDYAALAKLETLVFYMGVARLPAIAERLITAGRDAATPAAVVERAGSPRQRTIVATLATLAAEADAAGIAPPAVIIVGEVAKLHERLAWFEKLPLFGRTIIVTRPLDKSRRLAERLAELGAQLVEAAAIEVHPPEDYSQLDAAISGLSRFDWLVLTSANGVGFLFDRLTALGLDARALAGVKVAAVGPATAEALREKGIAADLVPEKFTTGDLGMAICALQPTERRRVLLARADVATPQLSEMLKAAGTEVTEVALYRTTRPAALPEQALEAIRQGKADWITFTSSSTVENFFALADVDKAKLKRVKFAVIGPVTARALESHGVKPAAIAEPHTIDALINAIRRAVQT
jgi:uroporphyrinogen III methyltransferase/synthase